MDRVTTSSSSAFVASYPSLSFHAITPIATSSGSANTFIVINDSMRSNHKGNKSKSSFFLHWVKHERHNSLFLCIIFNENVFLLLLTCCFCRTCRSLSIPCLRGSGPGDKCLGPWISPSKFEAASSNWLPTCCSCCLFWDSCRCSSWGRTIRFFRWRMTAVVWLKISSQRFMALLMDAVICRIEQNPWHFPSLVSVSVSHKWKESCFFSQRKRFSVSRRFNQCLVLQAMFSFSISSCNIFTCFPASFAAEKLALPLTLMSCVWQKGILGKKTETQNYHWSDSRTDLLSSSSVKSEGREGETGDRIGKRKTIAFSFRPCLLVLNWPESSFFCPTALLFWGLTSFP